MQTFKSAKDAALTLRPDVPVYCFRPAVLTADAERFMAAVGGAPAPKYGWTDVARFSELGIPAVNYGPGNPSLAHADDERVPIAQIRDVERGLTAWLSASI